MTRTYRWATAPLLALSVAAPAFAQTAADDAAPAPRRTRVTLGPQLTPSYPGADSVSLRPFIDLSRSRGARPFAFEAPDESAGFGILSSNGFSAGPAIGFEGKRKSSKVGGVLPTVGVSVELGGFVQYAFSDAVRVRAEARQAVSGHKALVGSVGADYIWRDADRWLFSLGPRVTLASGKYARTYYGVRGSDAAAAGLPAFDAGGGIQAVGVTAGTARVLSGPWGIYAYAKYDRLVDDAGRSPVVREFGSRNQLSGGVALSYTFGG